MSDGWVKNARGGWVKRYGPPRTPSTARSGLACPRIQTDTIDACQSQADGNYYDSLSQLRRTYRADGNPHGQEFIELGNEKLEAKEHVPDRGQRVQDIKKAMAMVDSGNVPSID